MKKAQLPLTCITPKDRRSIVAPTSQAAGLSAVLSVRSYLNPAHLSNWLIQNVVIGKKVIFCPYLDGIATYAHIECLNKPGVPNLFKGQDILFNWTDTPPLIHNLE